MFFYRFGTNHTILIELNERILNLTEQGEIIAAWPIAIGKPSTPTPLGQWEIINKKVLDSDGIFGSRWLGLSNPGYGIHGTNMPSSIGSAVSLGGIRMHNHNVEELFRRVNIGTPVLIVKQAPVSDSYQVRPGDTIWQIARKYNMSTEQLLLLNPKLDPRQLPVGKLLKLRKKC